METTLYLVRHGETDWNKQRRFQGQMDIPLNQIGLQQAKMLSMNLLHNSFKVDFLYSSDLKRAYDTAASLIANYNKEISVNPNLRERSFGKLEGVTFDEIKKLYPEINFNELDKYKNLDVEPFELFKLRIYEAITSIASKHINERVLIVSHGAAINAFLYHISDGHIGSGYTKIDNTSITTVIYNHRNMQWTIEEINNVSHMEAI